MNTLTAIAFQMSKRTINSKDLKMSSVTRKPENLCPTGNDLLKTWAWKFDQLFVALPSDFFMTLKVYWEFVDLFYSRIKFFWRVLENLMEQNVMFIVWHKFDACWKPHHHLKPLQSRLKRVLFHKMQILVNIWKNPKVIGNLATLKLCLAPSEQIWMFDP